MSVLDNITLTTNEAKKLSITVKKGTVSEQQIIDNFLDTILDIKRILNDRVTIIQSLTTGLEKITWFAGVVNDDTLSKLNDLISACRDLHSALNRSYVLCGESVRKVAKSEMSKYKTSIDELKEAFEDVEAIFFYMPNNENIQKIFNDIA